jgi:hypothetical protein
VPRSDVLIFVLDEREKLLDEVEQEWVEREKRATSLSSPGGSDPPEEESEGDTSDESEECIVKVQFSVVYFVGLQGVSCKSYSVLCWYIAYESSG